jgi:hypothetical protein
MDPRIEFIPWISACEIWRIGIRSCYEIALDSRPFGFLIACRIWPYALSPWLLAVRAILAYTNHVAKFWQGEKVLAG